MREPQDSGRGYVPSRIMEKDRPRRGGEGGFDSSRGGYVQQDLREMREPQDSGRGYVAPRIEKDRPRRGGEGGQRGRGMRSESSLRRE
jgi:hypothetical protein